MSKTTNYNLDKPAQTDFYDVDVFNSNMDIVDAELKKKDTKDAKDNTVTFTESTSRVTLSSGTTLSVLMGRIKKYFTDLKAFCFNDLATTSTDTSTTKAVSASVTAGLKTSIDGMTTDVSKKMDKGNPTGTGSLSMNRKAETVVGANSTTIGSNNAASGKRSYSEGNNNTSSGEQAHSEGDSTISSGICSHSEGMNTKATNKTSHAEGYSTTASGTSSHAEGDNTTASGTSSHSEGWSTIAGGNHSHVQGKFNLEDTENKYADIVGGGTSDTARKNIYTLDWSGNAYFAGNINGVNIETVNSDNTVHNTLYKGTTCTDCNSPTEKFIWCDANTLNTPYKQGKTSSTQGYLLSLLTDKSNAFQTQLFITLGGTDIFKRYKNSGQTTYTSWKESLFDTNELIAKNYTASITYSDNLKATVDTNLSRLWTRLSQYAHAKTTSDIDYTIGATLIRYKNITNSSIYSLSVRGGIVIAKAGLYLITLNSYLYVAPNSGASVEVLGPSISIGRNEVNNNTAYWSYKGISYSGLAVVAAGDEVYAQSVGLGTSPSGKIMSSSYLEIVNLSELT